MENNIRNEYFRELSKAVLSIQIDSDSTLKGLLETFYEVMAKHGVCQHETTNGHTVGYTPEFVMCKEMFLQSVEMKLNMMELLSETPEKIYTYGE